MLFSLISEMIQMSLSLLTSSCKQISVDFYVVSINCVVDCNLLCLLCLNVLGFYHWCIGIYTVENRIISLFHILANLYWFLLVQRFFCVFDWFITLYEKLFPRFWGDLTDWLFPFLLCFVHYNHTSSEANLVTKKHTNWLSPS